MGGLRGASGILTWLLGSRKYSIWLRSSGSMMFYLPSMTGRGVKASNDRGWGYDIQVARFRKVRGHRFTVLEDVCDDRT